MYNCGSGRCPNCGAPVKKCSNCGKEEYQPADIYPWYPAGHPSGTGINRPWYYQWDTTTVIPVTNSTSFGVLLS